AIKLAMDQKPHLILLDLLLPKVDGFAVLERIRKYPDSKISGTKVIILSNLWSNRDILRAQALKIDEYYVKANTSLDEVFAKIKEILGRLE
ncbi:MAG TPA: response regulator, partial [Patescibacteria group bacterium]|nr:response regulator [Patescibacteria group bacterium]